jgi:proline dehydrogenase
MQQVDGVINRMAMDFSDTKNAFSLLTQAQMRRYAFLFHLLQYHKWKLPIHGLVKRNLFHYFCGGETLQECKPVLLKLRSKGVEGILDYAAEAKSGEAEYARTFSQLQETLTFCADSIGAGFFGVLKLSAFCDSKGLETFSTWKHTPACATLEDRLVQLCVHTEAGSGSLLVDAEESWLQEGIDVLTLSLMERFNRERAVVYITLQMYRKDRLIFLHQLLKQAQEKNFFVGIKLVRGAYMEKERARALSRGYPSPIQEMKADTDTAYDAALDICLAQRHRVSVLVATHNEASTQRFANLLIQEGLSPQDPRYAFSQLYGMSDPISFALAHAGFRVCKYIPYGPVAEALPYLTRRALENSAMRGSANREFEWIRLEMARRRREK